MGQRGRGIWFPANPEVGHGMAGTLALLMEAATRNAVWAPNQTPYQRRGKGRGLGSLFPPHANPQFGLSLAGMGRARSRNPGPCPCPDPALHVPSSRPRCLYPHGDIVAPLLQNPSLDPHH